MLYRKTIALLCTGLIMIFIGTGGAYANTSDEVYPTNIHTYTTDDGYELVLAYVTNDGNSVRFDTKQASADGASEELIGKRHHE